MIEIFLKISWMEKTKVSYIRITTFILVTVSDSLMEWCMVPRTTNGWSVTIAKRAHVSLTRVEEVFTCTCLHEELNCKTIPKRVLTAPHYLHQV